MNFEPLILAGQLIGIAFACGLNLYATIGVLGTSARLDLVPALPPELRGLEHPIIIGSAVLLFLVEFVVDKIPHADAVWDAIHTFIRPTAAALLAVGAAAGSPSEVQVAGAVLAGTVALAAHGAKAGLRTVALASRLRRARPAISLLEDATAVALVIAVLRYPGTAVGLAAGGVLVIALVGPVLWRAFRLGLRALTARWRGFFGRPDWRGTGALPADLRALLPDPPPGRAPHRVARASVKGIRGVGAFRGGWLAITPDGAVFLYRTFLRPRSQPLPASRSAQVHPGIWADVIDLHGDRGGYTLFLLKDGPPARIALLDLVPAAR